MKPQQAEPLCITCNEPKADHATADAILCAGEIIAVALNSRVKL